MIVKLNPLVILAAGAIGIDPEQIRDVVTMKLQKPRFKESM